MLNAVNFVVAISYFFLTVQADMPDPTQQEIHLFDWTSGLRVAFCSDAPLSDLITPFRRAMARITTSYCQNLTACNLEESVVFGPEQVVFLDGYPKRDFGALQLKFLILLPHKAKMVARQLRPLLPRAVISDILGRNIEEIGNRLGWTIISYERYPRFDQLTEFMNIAIIPIVLFSVPLMVFLAYWTSTLRNTFGGEGWLVSGTGGGRSAAQSVTRRTMEIIAEQNAEIERQHQMEAQMATVGIIVEPSVRNSYIDTPSIVLDVTRLSNSNLAEVGAHEPVSSHHLQVGRSLNAPHQTPRRHSRRQSSIEDVREKRRSRGMLPQQPIDNRKKLKTGSLVLGAFRH